MIRWTLNESEKKEFLTKAVEGTIDFNREGLGGHTPGTGIPEFAVGVRIALQIEK